MTLSDEYKCIFIHINKTAGRSISISLFGMTNYHLTVKELFSLENDEIENDHRVKFWKEENNYKYIKNHWESYFKFCFVRNPWDRKLSDYFFNVSKNSINIHNTTFTQYLKDNHNNNDIWNSPALNWVEYEDGTLDPNIFIGRFENLQNDFNTICDKINIPRTILPVVNNTKHLPYWKYYTEETKNLILEKYKKDIDYFGYEFGK